MKTYEVTVIVKSKNYSETFTVQAEREGLAKTRAMAMAFDAGLHLSGELVEYEIKPNIVINKVYNQSLMPTMPYGVEVLADCSDEDPDQGSSEMSWYATEEEQQAYYEEISKVLLESKEVKPCTE